MELKAMKRERQPERPADTADPAPAVRFQKELLEEAYRLRASDVHIEPLADRIQVRYRIDGILAAGPTLPKALQENLASRFKINCNLNISEKRQPQDGSFRFQIGEDPLDLRVSCLPTLHGEKVVVRLLARERLLPGLDQLGLPDALRFSLENMVGRPQGMLLVVGPTGSGKSTTLYALLQAIRRPGINITTLEDPVEGVREGLNQIQVNEKVGLSFAAALRAVLRQDPDVIMVGEIRDEETALIAFRAALTGHLVLSTLHTNDSVATVVRLLNLGVPSYLVASSLLGVLAQRLVRKNCPGCLEPCRPDPDLIRRYPVLTSLGDPGAPEPFRGAGCPGCRGTGIAGREGIFELLTVTPAVREAIQQRVSEGELRSLALTEGMETLMGCALEKVRQGIIGPEEVLRVVPYEVGTRACPHCRFPLEDAYRYCPYCASPLGRHCPDCGQPWKPNWRLCPRCGRKPPEELQ